MSRTNHKSDDFSPFRERMHEIIYEADTPMGKNFDIVLLIFILSSVVVVMLDSVESLYSQYHRIFIALEWVFTIFFTIEYIMRIYTVHRPWKYIFSYYGMIDLLATVPTYLSFFLAGSQSLVVIRILRILRIFRIFKLASYMRQGHIIMRSLNASKEKIFVFMLFVLLMVTILGSIMYLIEGGANDNFDSIPRSVYWAIVTLTTVGYGDISPVTPFGQLIASMIMMLGYSIIAVPTGIITAETIREHKTNAKPPKILTAEKMSSQACRFCCKEGHDKDAVHCKFCGERLNPESLENE